MMLDHLGFPDGEKLVMQALTDTLTAGTTTADIGGRANTREVTEAVCARIKGFAGTVGA
jgi:tartrate dehydrogenase/decarboxylase/D-malate dehydrogenase